MEDSPRLMHVEKVGCARQGQAATRRQSWVRVSQKNSVSSSMLRRGAGTANGHPQSFSATQARTISRHVVRRCREDIDGKIQELSHLASRSYASPERRASAKAYPQRPGYPCILAATDQEDARPSKHFILTSCNFKICQFGTWKRWLKGGKTQRTRTAIALYCVDPKAMRA